MKLDDGRLARDAAPEMVVVMRGLAAPAQTAGGDVGKHHAENLTKGGSIGGLQSKLLAECKIIAIHLSLGERKAWIHLVGVHQPW